MLESTNHQDHKFKKIQHHAWHSKLVADIKLKLFYVGKGVSDLKACLDYCEDLAKVAKTEPKLFERMLQMSKLVLNVK